jgi:hypothetical protein
MLCLFRSAPDLCSVTVGLAEQFCIIEGAETMQDFARMQLKEIKENIASRRNKIFLLMEEVRNLNSLKSGGLLIKEGLRVPRGGSHMHMLVFPKQPT